MTKRRSEGKGRRENATFSFVVLLGKGKLGEKEGKKKGDERQEFLLLFLTELEAVGGVIEGEGASWLVGLGRGEGEAQGRRGEAARRQRGSFCSSQ